MGIEAGKGEEGKGGKVERGSLTSMASRVMSDPGGPWICVAWNSK